MMLLRSSLIKQKARMITGRPKQRKIIFSDKSKRTFRESIEQNKNDKKKMAEQCRDYKKKLEARLKEDQEQKK